MTVSFNHTIIYADDEHASASFFTELFNLPPAVAWGPFISVALDHDGLIQFAAPGMRIQPQHYAFLVTEEEFDTPRGWLMRWSDAATGLRQSAGRRCA